jgi:cystathionine gamma-synthase
VKRVLTAERGATAGDYAKVSRGPHRPGALITFDLKGDLTSFYDAVLLPKGPSFGLKFTLLCPFLWLAHYDMVTTEEGRARIRAANLDPDLVRLSVGTEPPEVIIAALKEALDKQV